MDHDLAIRNRAAERYLLKEMSSGERDEFEAHFFECAVCAGEVRTADAFIRNTRAVLSASPAPAWPEPETDQRASQLRGPRAWNLAWWRPSFALPALAVLIVMIGYPWVFVVPRLKRELAVATAPRAVMAHVLLPESRGEPSTVAVRRGVPLLLVLDVNAAGSFPRYFATIETAAGTAAVETEVPTPSSSEPFHFVIPDPKLEAGRYVLILRGATAGPRSGTELARYHFQVQTQ